VTRWTSKFDPIECSRSMEYSDAAGEVIAVNPGVVPECRSGSRT
jgi:hypothetical protein